jgi:pimeloyl-ACP methyl ester carboxylesterase
VPVVDTSQGPAYYVAAGVDGEEAPVVLIHGAGGSHLDWPPAFRKLPGRRTLALDLPGHGRTPAPGRRDIGGYADWVREWLLALELPPAVLLGHSMGGAIALDLAWRAPDAVQAVVAIGVGARMPVAPAILDRIVTAPAEAIACIVERAYGRHASPELMRLGRQRMAQIEPQVLHGDFVACDVFDMTTRLGEVRSPALVVVGSRDRMTPAAGAEALHAGLPHSELVVIDDAGHMLTFERTEEAVRIIEDFLGRLA